MIKNTLLNIEINRKKTSSFFCSHIRWSITKGEGEVFHITYGEGQEISSLHLIRQKKIKPDLNILFELFLFLL